MAYSHGGFKFQGVLTLDRPTSGGTPRYHGDVTEASSNPQDGSNLLRIEACMKSLDLRVSGFLLELQGRERAVYGETGEDAHLGLFLRREDLTGLHEFLNQF